MNNKRLFSLILFFVLLISFGFAWYTDDPTNTKNTTLKIYSDSSQAKCGWDGTCETLIKIQNNSATTQTFYLDALFPKNYNISVQSIQEQTTQKVTKYNYVQKPCTIKENSYIDGNGKDITQYECLESKIFYTKPDGHTYTLAEPYETEEIIYKNINQNTSKLNSTSSYNQKYYDTSTFEVAKRITEYNTTGLKPNETKTLRIIFKAPKNTQGEFLIASSIENSILDPWWNTSWLFKRQITITNNNPSIILQDTNNAIWIRITNQLGTNALANCNDVRIIKGDTTEIDRNAYGNCQNDANIWFNLPTSISAGGTDNNYYLYYGNVTATAPNSPSNLVNNSIDLNTTLLLPFDNASTTAIGLTPTTNGTITYNTTRVNGTHSAGGFSAANHYDYDAGSSQLNPGSWTIESWVYLTTIGGIADYIYSQVNGAEYLHFFVNSLGTLKVQTSSMLCIPGDELALSGTLVTNRWYNIALVKNNATNTLDIYLDGIKSASAVNSCPTSYPSGTATIGAQNNDTSNYMQGLIDDFRITSGTARTLYPQHDMNSTWRPTTTLGDVNMNSTGGLSADINVTPNYDTLILDLNNVSIDVNVTEFDWNWTVNGATTGIGNPDANNTYFSPITPNTDYNVCLSVAALGADTLIYKSYKCETTSIGNIFGRMRLRIYDENTNSQISGTVKVDGNGQTFSISNTGSTDINYNLAGITTSSGTVTTMFTFTKTDYGTRYYQADINKWDSSSIDLNFMLLPSSLGSTIAFKFTDIDKNTPINQRYVELDKNTGKTVGRLKTSATGNASFFISIYSDQNYVQQITRNNGTTVTQLPVTLTILQPLNQISLTPITEPWRIDISENQLVSYTNLNAQKIVQILANTLLPYIVTIQDQNQTKYYPQSYNQQFYTSDVSSTLQPYLLDKTVAPLSYIRTQDLYTLLPIGNVSIQVYTSVLGVNTLVSSLTTDSSGSASIAMIANQTYTWLIYYNGSLISTQTIVAPNFSGQTYYISINSGFGNVTPIGNYLLDINFSPNISVLHKYDTALVQNVTFLDYNSNLVITGVTITVTNTNTDGNYGNNLVIYTSTTVSPSMPFTNSIPINYLNNTLNGVPYDSNGSLVVKVLVTTSQGNKINSISYTPVRGINFIQAIGFDIRPLVGCSATDNNLIPCAPLLLTALFVAIVISVIASISMGYVSMTSIGGLFIFLMGVFTYINWVPYLIFGIMFVGTVGLMIAEGGRRV